MLETDDGLNAISHVNHLLLKNSIYPSSPSYYVEFVKTPVLSTYHVTTYSLRVIRSEPARSVQILYKEEPSKWKEMKVSKLVICEYDIQVKDLVVTKSKVNTLLAQRYMQDDLHYQQRGFAKLLIHLLVHICACARLRQEVLCSHAASDKVYSMYTKKISKNKPLATLEHSYGGANEYLIDSSLMDKDQVIKLKKVSMEEVVFVVTNMTNHREIKLDANKYMVTI